MDASTKGIKAQIEEFDKRIEEEARRMAIHTQAKREETQRKLDEAKEAVQVAERQLHDLSIEKKKVCVDADKLKEEGNTKNSELQDLRKQIEGCDSMIASARKAETDALTPYGRDIKQVLERIRSMRWAGDPPIGPLGLHVKAKDPQKWGEILRTMLGSYLTAFALTDARDRPQLKKLLMDTGKYVVVCSCNG
jgi:chromosome segregation ATPase